MGRVGETVYEDPYLAIDTYVAELISDWEVAPYALDFIEYSVGESHSYPRFLCYDCHGYRPYTSWNPYTYACTDFRVVLWDDPYYHPAYRYAGARVVFPRPLRDRPRYALAARAPGEGWSPLVRVRQAPPLPRRVTQYKERDVATTPRSAPRQAVPRRSATAADRSRVTPNSARRSAKPVTPSSATPRRPASSGSRARPTLRRRPVPTRILAPTPRGTNVRPPTNARPSARRTPTRSGSPARVVTPSRPSTQPRVASPRRAPITRRAPSSGSRPSASTSRPSTSRARPTTGRARPAPPRATTRATPARRPTLRARPKPPPTPGRTRRK